MNHQQILMIVAYFIVLIILSIPLGHYMASVFDKKNNLITIKKPLTYLEHFFLKFSLVNPQKEMNWKEYTTSLLLFNFLGFVFLFLFLIFQDHLFLNPENKPGLSFWTALNTSISFVTNTNWQSYVGETSLSYFSQMIGLTVQNFLSAATGIVVSVVFIRGLRQKSSNNLGNFWVDLLKCVTRILLPLSFVVALFLSSQGILQNFLPYQKTKTLEGKEQIIPMGPVASQVAIKQLGTNGGGFFGANGAHPFENPTPLSNFIQSILILLLPMALVFMYGSMVGHKKQSWTIFTTMMVIMIIMLLSSQFFENQTNPFVFNLPFLEGKEWRFNLAESSLWSMVTTAASNGSVNNMHSSLSPMSSLLCLFNMMMGEIIFGGVGSGLYGMILFILLTVFLAGLMVGRTPEYLGKKIEAKEVVWISIAVLVPGLVNLTLSAMACLFPEGLASLGHSGPHGLSEIFYAFTSAVGNNGSAFGSLNADTPFYNGLIALGMIIGRYAVIIPVMAIAGELSLKKIIPPSLGTLPTENILFVILLISVIVIVGALTFFPALVLAPLAEHLLLKGIIP